LFQGVVVVVVVVSDKTVKKPYANAAQQNIRTPQTPPPQHLQVAVHHRRVQVRQARRHVGAGLQDLQRVEPPF
jgi:hypothetical protein